MIIAGFISCSKKHNTVITYYDLENKQMRESYTVRADSPSIREGEYLLYGMEGNLVERRKYSNNLISDTLIKYYGSGSVSEKSLFKAGIQDGPRRVFFESGPLMILEHYVNGKFEGLYQSFYENGTMKEEGQYVNDRMTGKWTYYYDTGELKEEVYFENNEEHGPFVSYYKSGKLKATGTYAHGLKTGGWKYFDEDGQEMPEEDLNAGVTN